MEGDVNYFALLLLYSQKTFSTYRILTSIILSELVLNILLLFRTNEKYLTDLGQACLNFYRTIPGGVLVFFPSYPFLKSCIEFWQENGTWNRMANIKVIFFWQ